MFYYYVTEKFKYIYVQYRSDIKTQCPGTLRKVKLLKVIVNKVKI